MHNPIAIFKENWQQAQSLNDASADYCSLATVSESGQVSIRTLVLREVTEDSFVIFINSTSPKWEQLEHSKQIELLVFWPTLMQQYRVRGEVGQVSTETMKTHWAKKPYESKILDHYYTEYHPQTTAIDSRETLLSGIGQLKSNFPAEADIPFPQDAKGVAIKATYVEAWRGSNADRLHERELYLFIDGQWQRNILVP